MYYSLASEAPVIFVSEKKLNSKFIEKKIILYVRNSRFSNSWQKIVIAIDIKQYGSIFYSAINGLHTNGGFVAPPGHHKCCINHRKL